MSNEIKETVFLTVRKFLQNPPPVIIWGSGGTIPYGLPTMDDLNTALREKIKNFNPGNQNLETELENEKYQEQMTEIRKVIWETINSKDNDIHKQLIDGKMDQFCAIKSMIDKFKGAHPKCVNIVTTNYDRVLEYVMGYYDIPFSDGFTGREFSRFNKENFKEKEIVNLIKVHGSLNWFWVGEGDKIRYLTVSNNNVNPAIIPPGKGKYREAYRMPYRDLIQKSDDLIDKANSFLVVGFGFNDEHLTPKIKQKVNNGTPLVLITKEVIQSCRDELKNARKYILLQRSKTAEQTRVIMKTGRDDISRENHLIDGDYWQLGKFMENL